MFNNLGAQEDRLTYLKKINPSVRDEEILWVRRQRDELTSLLEKAELRLDSFRVIL